MYLKLFVYFIHHYICNYQSDILAHKKLFHSLVAQRLKCLPAMWETWVRSLGQEDPLEKEMATQSSILAWRIPWTEEPDRLRSRGHKESDKTEATEHSHMQGYIV